MCPRRSAPMAESDEGEPPGGLGFVSCADVGPARPMGRRSYSSNILDCAYTSPGHHKCSMNTWEAVPTTLDRVGRLRPRRRAAAHGDHFTALCDLHTLVTFEALLLFQF